MSVLKKVLIGNTVKMTWVNSGTTASPISVSVLDNTDISVNSIAMTDSGNGHYFADVVVPNSVGYYVAETTAVVSGNTYKNRMKFKTITCEVT